MRDEPLLPDDPPLLLDGSSSRVTPAGPVSLFAALAHCSHLLSAGDAASSHQQEEDKSEYAIDEEPIHTFKLRKIE